MNSNARQKKKGHQRAYHKVYLERTKEKGYAELSQRELAKDFGISAAAFYNHFKSKDALLNEVLKLVSKTIYEGYHPDDRNEIDSTERLILFGEYLINMFQRQPHLMEFLLFSPNALKVYSQRNKFGNSPLFLLSKACTLIEAVKNDHNLKQDIYVLLTKWWAFLQGYTMLVSKGIAEYREELVREAVSDVIAGEQRRNES